MVSWFAILFSRFCITAPQCGIFAYVTHLVEKVSIDFQQRTEEILSYANKIALQSPSRCFTLSRTVARSSRILSMVWQG